MKIAVAGLGVMGATHVGALRRIPGAELAAVVSSDTKKLSGDLSGVRGNLSEPVGNVDFSGVARYRTLEECLGDDSVEAVDICLPTDLHEKAALACLRAGKHVLVEKPLARDEAAARRIIEEAHRANRVLMCGQVLRFLPHYRVAAETLPSLGTTASAMFRRKCGTPSWSPWLTDDARSGGAVMDLLIHDVDFSLRLFGPPQSIAARGFTDARLGIDWIAAELRYEQSGPVVIEGGWCRPASYPFSMGFTIMAENGTLEYGSREGQLSLFRPDAEGETVAVPDEDGFERELSYFLECAAGGRKPLLCPPEDSALAVRLVGSMLRSRERNGERLDCLKSA